MLDDTTPDLLSQTLTNASYPSTRGTFRWSTFVLILSILALAGVSLVFFLTNPSSPQYRPLESFHQTNFVETSFPSECSDPSQVIIPSSFTNLRTSETYPMGVVGTDLDGLSAGVPDSNDGHTVAWFDKSAPLGSSQGTSLLTAHTFQLGGAVGNDLLDPSNLKPGDVILVTGHDSHQCFRYEGYVEVSEDHFSDYEDQLYDLESDPRFILVVCTDYTPWGTSTGRVLFYATPIN